MSSNPFEDIASWVDGVGPFRLLVFIIVLLLLLFGFEYAIMTEEIRANRENQGVVEMNFTVNYERNEKDGMWEAVVQGMEGVQARGRTLDETEKKIRKKLEVGIKLIRNVRIPEDLQEALDAYEEAKKELEK